MFPHIKLLSTPYMYIHILKLINCIVKCNIILYSYCSCVSLVHILCIHLQTLKYIYIYVYVCSLYTSTDFNIYIYIYIYIYVCI